MKNAQQSAWDSFMNYMAPPVSPLPGKQQSQFAQDIGNAAQQFGRVQYNALTGAIHGAQNLFSGQNIAPVQSVQATALPPSPTPTPSPAPNLVNGLSPADYEQIIKTGFQNWGSGQQIPMSQYASHLAQLPAQYPMFQKNPYMIPALSILETGGANPQKMKFANNPFNWGAPVGYSPDSIPTAIERTASGIAQRYPVYQPFRRGNLTGFGQVYAPVESNPGTGGPFYDANLKRIVDIFNQAEAKYRKK